MKRQNVGSDLKILTEEGLVEIIDTQGGRDVYAKKPLDKTLRVSKFLQEEFNLGPTGLPLISTNNKRKASAKKSEGK